MSRLLAFVAAVLSAGCLQAHAADFDPQAAAVAALEKAGGGAWFDVVPDESFAQLRHRASGLACNWGPNDTAEITVYPPSPNLVAEGENVGCAVQTMFGNHTFYATRYAVETPLELDLKVAAAAISARYPGAREVKPAKPSGLTAALRDRLPSAELAQFIVRGPEGDLMTRVTVTKIGGWVFKVRYTGQVGMDDRADAVWLSALREPLRSRGLPPYDKGPLAAPKK